MPRRWKIALTISFASAIGLVFTLLTPAAASRHLILTDKLSFAPAAMSRRFSVHPAPTVTVRPGDSLSRIAASKHVYGNASDWTVLYWANHGIIRWANLVEAGQVLTVPPLPAVIPAPPAQLAPAPPPPPPAPVTATAPVQAPAPAPPAPGGSYGGPAGSFEACVIQAESGGDPTAYNPSSGASGLFGFLLSTWDNLGLGYPGGAYTAPASVQYEGFGKLYAEAGTAPWAPYDGC
jgi:hypothetical protein